MKPFPKMNPEVKTRWLEALRSGKFKQGLKSLFSPASSTDVGEGSYCCLGVLCEIEGALVRVGDGVHRGVRISEAGVEGDRTEYYRPPAALLQKWGLSTHFDVDAVGHLVRMNDGPTRFAIRPVEGLEDRKYTFPEIATWIEENL